MAVVLIKICYYVFQNLTHLILKFTFGYTIKYLVFLLELTKILNLPPSNLNFCLRPLFSAINIIKDQQGDDLVRATNHTRIK